MKIKSTSLWLLLVVTFAAINMRETKKYMSVLSTSADSKHSADTPRLTTASHQQSVTNGDIDDTFHGVLMYPQNPLLFTNILLQCLGNPTCHLMYHHIPKTAGTFIASSLYPVFENGTPYRSSDWCCFEVIMNQFVNDTQKYCTKHKMGIYEVRGNEFSQVLETCEQEYAKQGHTYVGLVSTREPVQRTISLIHQQCNSGYREKNPRYQAFCRNCTFDMNSPDSVSFWTQFVEDTNIAFQTMDDYIATRKSLPHIHPTSNSSNNNSHDKKTKMKAPILVIDNSMVNDLFYILDVGLKKNNKPPLKRGRENAEKKLAICNFGMTSAMLKRLQPASTIFLDLWSGYGDAKQIISE